VEKTEILEPSGYAHYFSILSTSAILKLLRSQDLDGIGKLLKTACAMNPQRVY
jgi:hypothetical protein